jgi:hypothetical protein
MLREFLEGVIGELVILLSAWRTASWLGKDCGVSRQGCQVMNGSRMATVSHPTSDTTGPSLEKGSGPGKFHLVPTWIVDEGRNLFRFSGSWIRISEMLEAGCLEDCLVCDLEDFDFPHLEML